MINIFDFEKYPNENEEQYLWRLCSAKEAGIIDITWNDLANYFNTYKFGDEEDKYLGESAYRKKYQYAKLFYDNVFAQLESSDYLEDLSQKTRTLTKERMKLQTEKIEYNRWLRSEARDELLLEKITDAINNLQPLDLVPLDLVENTKPVNTGKEYLLIFGDEHYGAEFEILGLNGEVLNEYSPEIFEKRMRELMNQTIKIIKKEGITTLNIFSMGDFADGILRVSQLKKLRYGVVEATVNYAEFISSWLNVLSRYVKIKYQQTAGNHTELRMLGQPKGTFEDENVEKLLAELIKLRLKDNPNFEFIENPTGYNFANLCGYNIMGIHGEVRRLDDTIKNFSDIYNKPIDYLVAGHLHHNKMEEIGVNREVLNMGSIIGFDPYSLKLQKTSNASGKLIIFEENKGKTCEYTLKLN